MRTLTIVVLWLGFCFSRGFSQDTGQPASEFAAVRLAHVSPDAPLLDLLIDGRLRLQDVNYMDLSTYLVLPAGEHELRVQPHRAPSATDTETQSRGIQAPEPFIISETLEPGRYYTLVTSGFFDPPPAQGELGNLTLSMTEGTTVTVTGPRAYTVTVTESADLSELIPGTYSVTASREGFKTSQYEVEVRPNESAFLSIALQANNEGETSEPPEPPLANNTEPNSGGPEWDKVQLQLYEDELQTFPLPGFVLLRVIHASPVTPAVSVILARQQQNNDEAQEPLLTGLAYPNEVDYLSVAAGRVTFRLQNDESGQTITELENLELRAGTVYTFFVVGTRDDNFVSVIPTVDAILAGQP
jgi:Domain of unknown function (DUF4397)